MGGYKAETAPDNLWIQSARCLLMPQQRGFTLIELMIAIAIIAILASVAYPSYTEYVRKGRRSDAIVEINRVSQALERWRGNNPTYNATVVQLGVATAGTNTFTALSGYYTIAISNAAPFTYTVTASAAGRQTSDTRCATMAMAVNGGTITYTSSTAPAAECWRR
jgi:type IV pilus assembly protein PilE